MKSFGKNLQELRTNKALTQKELGEILNVRNTTVSAWEQDIAEPPYEVLKQLCLIFEVSADYLLGLEE